MWNWLKKPVGARCKFFSLFILHSLVHIFWFNNIYWVDLNQEVSGLGGGWLTTAMTNTDLFSAFMEFI